MYTEILEVVKKSNNPNIEVKLTDKETGWAKTRARHPVHIYRDRSTGKLTKITINQAVLRNVKPEKLAELNERCVSWVEAQLKKDI